MTIFVVKGNLKELSYGNFRDQTKLSLPWVLEACLALLSLSHYTPPLPAFGRPRHFAKVCREKTSGTRRVGCLLSPFLILLSLNDKSINIFVHEGDTKKIQLTNLWPSDSSSNLQNVDFLRKLKIKRSDQGLDQTNQRTMRSDICLLATVATTSQLVNTKQLSDDPLSCTFFSNAPLPPNPHFPLRTTPSDRG